jgi:hypothetical protein
MSIHHRSSSIYFIDKVMLQSKIFQNYIHFLQNIILPLKCFELDMCVSRSVPSSVLHFLDCMMNRSEVCEKFHTKGSTMKKDCCWCKSTSDTMTCVGIILWRRKQTKHDHFDCFISIWSMGYKSKNTQKNRLIDFSRYHQVNHLVCSTLPQACLCTREPYRNCDCRWSIIWYICLPRMR